METRMIGAQEVSAQFGVSKAYAYKVIRKLNEELEASGKLVVVGKVSAAFFEQRFFGEAMSTVKDGDFDGRN
ncbi:MAG: LysR family transcriptional regulator [Gordonibacter sp.]|uniref:LysR family transcriptional regulator n=1 Tax=Gordonibacter sp. TaxID=1968902 RepID=UPI002FCA3A93